MAFKKGEISNPKGRKPGVGNKSTEAAKQLFMDVMSGSVNKFKGALDELYAKDKIKWLDIVSKFFPYYLPKKTDVTSGGDKINTELSISVTSDKAKKNLEDLINEDN